MKKKIPYLLIILGIICLIVIMVISALSEYEIVSKQLETIGFIFLGYLGVVLFTYGWLKRKKSK
jgi:threonine/homoserine/homoserine lactone efflux protein